MNKVFILEMIAFGTRV